MDNYKNIKISDLIFHRNAHKISRNKNIEELSEHIKVHGLINPIIVTENTDGEYKIISGFRRFLAVKELLNWDEIPCHVISVDSAEDVDAILLGEHLTTYSVSIDDLSNMFNDLFSKFGDVRIAAQKSGISEKLFRKYVKFRRLPPLVQDYISVNSKNLKKDVKLGVRAADALNWSPGGDVSAEKVLDLMKALEEYDKKDAKHDVLTDGYWKGHLRDDSGNISGDAYSFEGSDYAVIGHGDDRGFFKNEKNMTRKMTREEFEKLPDEFRNSLRLQPHWK